VSLFPTTTKETVRWFLDELHRRYQRDNVPSLVDDTDHLGPVLAEDGSRFPDLGWKSNRYRTYFLSGSIRNIIVHK